MPEITVVIAGREYNLACAEHEIAATKAASILLDDEIKSSLVRNPNAPMQQLLLLSAIILADKVSALKAEIRAANDRISDLEQHASESGLPMPDSALAETLKSFATRTEKLANRLEQALPEER
ncbi:MAG: cell division protein ZapA [Albidovulum sp.]|nr:cell division protein ZapA [Albidovulum sp.]MDE0531245.1 cell division protein ZapA [Albidovulum sp.]